jgi:hypothetical protein
MYTAETTQTQPAGSPTTSSTPVATDHIAPASHQPISIPVTLPLQVDQPEVASIIERDSGIDTAKRDGLAHRFTMTVNNPRFWAKLSRVQALEDALVIPVFDDKSLQQFYNHAMADLKAEAAEKSSRSGTPAVMPTEGEGKAEAWSRYEAKLNATIRKELKKTGAKVGEDEVNVRVKEAMDKLIDLENANK